jgi:putative DNA primase/helicase
VTVSADLVLRTVAIRLDAQSERPEERSFEFDPIERVRTDRGGYLAAVFTIAKAFMAAGEKPKGMKVVAGFEEWSRLVQQPLVWLGMPDPLGNRETLRGLDEKEQELDQILDVLKKYQNELGNKGFTVAQLARLANELGHGNFGDYRRPDLRELMSFNGKINERSFGKLLSRHRDRIRDGWCVAFARTDHKVSVYRLLGPKDKQQGDLGI